MDTKWKKFSRSMAVRAVLNILMIGCIITEMLLCLNIYNLNKQQYQQNEAFFHKTEDNLYGNTELQENFQNTWISLIEYTMINNMHGESSAKTQKSDNNKEQLQYQLKMTDHKGKEKNFSNCAKNLKTLKDTPIYILYQGYLNGDTYIRDSVNSYQGGENEDSALFGEWFQVNAFIDTLCQGNQEYSQYVASNMVNQISVYKDDIVDCLSYFYKTDFDNKTTIQSIIEKLYGDYDFDNNIYLKSTKLIINKIIEDYGEQEEDLSYDETTGLFYSESSDWYYYYNYKSNKIEEYGEIDSEFYDRLKSEMDKVKKKEEKTKDLTKEEKDTLLQIISKAIYIGNNGLSEESQIIIPIAAVLGTPQEYSIYIGVDDSLFQATQGIYMEQYEKDKNNVDAINAEMSHNVSAFFGVMIFLGFVVLALLYVCGRKAGTEEIQYLEIDRWYTEIQGIFMIALIVLGCVCLVLFAEAMADIRSTELYNNNEVMIVITCLAILALIFIEFLCSIARKAKGRILFRQSIIGKIIGTERKKLYHNKINQRVMNIYILVCFTWLCFEFLGFSFYGYEDDISFLVFMQFILVCLFIGVGIFLRRYLLKLEEIRDGVKRVKAGEIKYQIPTDDSDTPLNLFAKDINSLSEGLESAVDEMLKSERLKTELISNVSHDIKTPLTSIITYVDLMKQEDVQPEKVKEYIAVLDQKSQRLKTLTDDLFEAAKATSGAMTMDAACIDLGSLVNQAIGEFSEKLEKADLDVRNTIEENIFYIMADGKLTWRIMENLLGNVSKYALTGSRVYIDAADIGNAISFVIKNISNTELNISADELMERFTRGDQSRNTEGSGLGLNIAESLAVLQGGEFHVEVDGDLFKAILILPKADVSSL